VLDMSGEILEQCAITNHRDSLRRLSVKYPADRITIEVGSYSPWISRFLTILGHEVIVANARKFRAISSNLRKLLVGAAQYILGPFGPDSDLRKHGLDLADRGGRGAKNQAA
jgi:hypothetical protein